MVSKIALSSSFIPWITRSKFLRVQVTSSWMIPSPFGTRFCLSASSAEITAVYRVDSVFKAQLLFAPSQIIPVWFAIIFMIVFSTS